MYFTAPTIRSNPNENGQLPVEVGAVAPKPPNPVPPRPGAADVVAVLNPPNAGAGADVAGAPKPMHKWIEILHQCSHLTHNNQQNLFSFNRPVAPNVFCPNADGAPKPWVCCGAAAAVATPKAGGAADVAGALNVKFPNAAKVIHKDTTDQ